MPLPEHSRCPPCRAALWAPGSKAIDQKTCPRCDAKLWALAVTEGSMFFLRQQGQSERAFLASLMAPVFGLSPQEAKQALEKADSLDLVELVMEWEEASKSCRA